MKTNKSKWATKFLTGFLTVLFFFSCSNKHSEKMAIENVAVSESYNAVKTEEVKTNSITKRPLNLKIIKSATVKYKVKNVKTATNKITKIVEELNGYISDLRYQDNLYQKENRFTIKIPKDNFNAIMDSIVKFAEFVEFENITTKDVTEEYIDLQTRLNTKLEVKKRYESILRKRAKTVEDILATEEKLRIIQEEIEASQGRLNYLTNKVSLSTVEVELYETVTYKEEPVSYSKTFISKMKNGFSFGWELIENLFIGIIYIWPLILMGILVFLFFKRRRKKK